MSWSIKITILYLSFVVLIVSMVIISSNNGEELVAKDYYAQELAYQSRIDAINNEASLENGLTFSVNNESIIFEAPQSLLHEKITGEIYFFSPAKSSNDKKIKIEFINGQQVVNKSLIQPGAYKVKVEYNAAGKPYFHEGVVNIQ